jgi:2-keto-3-deoxy-L-rhamnonate aldolase RhmA
MPTNIRNTIKNEYQEVKVEARDFSDYLCDDNSSIFFQKLKVNPLIVFYITNKPEIALIAEKYGVDRIWIDLETLGKEIRQKDMDTVKSHHTVLDIAAIKPFLTRAEMLVRINSWYGGSKKEVEDVISAGADIIMLPYWKTAEEVKNFLDAVNGRCKTTLLLETREAVDCIDEVLKQGGFDEIHIGLNDLHLSYGMTFMFELLADGIVESLCKKFRAVGVPYGFGGIAKLGDGLLPAEKIIMEHYRLGSTRAILSRTFCDNVKIDRVDEIDKVFKENMASLREYELSMINVTKDAFIKNKAEVVKVVEDIVDQIKRTRSNEQ